MTHQEIFDKALDHLRKQGKAAVNVDGGCAYRGENGTMCAVGCLIPDEAYSRSIEGASIPRLLRPAERWNDRSRSLARALVSSGIDADAYPLLEALQSAHDNELSRKGLPAWESRMREIAATYSLVYREPAQI